MQVKSRKPVSITIKGKKTALLPHHAVTLADSEAKKLLSQHPDLFKRVKGGLAEAGRLWLERR